MWGTKTRPWGLKWRASSWMITAVIGLGIAVDLVVYSCIIPVMPFHLEKLGFSDVAGLTGWLLFAYSGGLVLSTIPIAMFSERYNTRKYPLILGLVILTGSQIMLMEAPNLPVMVIARILQGIGSSMVWVVGLALLCDSSPVSIVGLQLGIAMTGLSVGLAIGPPVGGILYNTYGYRGPFIFGIAATFLDFIGRLILIERQDALVWGYDPQHIDVGDSEGNEVVVESGTTSDINRNTDVDKVATQHDPKEDTVPPTTTMFTGGTTLSLISVMHRLSKSSRALVSLFLILSYGVVYSCQEPTLPLHLQSVWGLDSFKVGLVFIAAVVPTLVSSPLTGYLTDKNGAEWVTVLSLLLALPWWVIITIESHLALFITAFAIETFFTAGVISPLTAELAAVSRDIEGVGYGHVYGAFNLVYGIGTTIGPIIGGQVYDHLRRGWLALCLLAMGLLALSDILAFCFVGSNPILRRTLLTHRR